ncbi:MAG: fasciclin domain-containing protein [Erythrobacter sp.]|uniref:fasciclin domain-containing protein n=1 Tax=Erythrobacter sp. TaxID=1042 RepID=UPI003C7411F0
MKMFKLTLATSAALALAACGAETDVEDDAMMADETAMTEDATAPGTVVEVAQNDGQFSTLVEAVTAADLGDTLSGDGPYTIFAPTNDAFAKLPEGTLETLTTEDTDQLANILQYHVVDGTVNAQTLTAAIEEAGEGGYEINTLGGGTLTAMLQDGSVVLTDAAGNTSTVTATDVEASNGVIHVIDTVLMPE